MINRMAVYGTLKRGKCNHHVLGPDAKRVGVSFLPDYSMYSLGGFPGIKFEPPESEGIEVEIYEDFDLKAVDNLEGEGVMYRREIVNIRGEDAYIYVFIPPVSNYKLVPNGNWI